jgi:hypothetical protein
LILIKLIESINPKFQEIRIHFTVE